MVGKCIQKIRKIRVIRGFKNESRISTSVFGLKNPQDIPLSMILSSMILSKSSIVPRDAKGARMKRVAALFTLEIGYWTLAIGYSGRKIMGRKLEEMGGSWEARW